MVMCLRQKIDRINLVAEFDFKVYCFKKRCRRVTIGTWWIIGKAKYVEEKKGRAISYGFNVILDTVILCYTFRVYCKSQGWLGHLMSLFYYLWLLNILNRILHKARRNSKCLIYRGNKRKQEAILLPMTCTLAFLFVKDRLYITLSIF